MNITYTVYASYNSWSYCFLSLLVLITQPRSKREAITTTERWRHISLWKSISFVWQGERRKLVNCWHFNCFLMGYLFIFCLVLSVGFLFWSDLYSWIFFLLIHESGLMCLKRHGIVEICQQKPKIQVYYIVVLMNISVKI